MPNAWIEHVKKYAAKNKMTYACAIPEAAKTYIKVDKAEAKEKREMKKEAKKKNFSKEDLKIMKDVGLI